MYVYFDVLYSLEKRVEILSFPCLRIVQIQSFMKGKRWRRKKARGETERK